MELEFAWVDVFADLPLTGNPLALVPDADALDDTRMREIAREFNQSETTFLVRPTLDADHRLRSFTAVGAEVLGAGHNAMGAWIWLAATGRLDPDRTEFTQQIGDQVLPVRVDRGQDGSPRVTMRQSDPRFLSAVRRRGDLAEALGVGLEEMAERSAEVVFTGAEHLMVELVSPQAVDRARADGPRLKEILREAGAEGCYVFAAPGRADHDAYTRFFNPTVGIVEDPATGTAAGPLAALLARDGRVRDPRRILFEQGRAMGRPSTLELSVDGSKIELSGSGLVIGQGTLRL